MAPTAATPVASETPPQPSAAPTAPQTISTAASSPTAQAAPSLVVTPAAKRHRFVESLPTGSSSVKYTPLDTVLADNKSINVDPRVSFVALTKQTQSGQRVKVSSGGRLTLWGSGGVE
eukprot:4215086-Amphidinium_carterae.1